MSDPNAAYLTEEGTPPQSQAKELLIQEFMGDNYASDGSTLGEIGEAEKSSTEATRENWLNVTRVHSYKAQFSHRFLEVIRDAEFEFGYDSAVDDFLRERLAENALATKDWLNSLFIENFADPQVASGILRVIAHLDYQAIAPQGPTIALAALSHKSLEVRECGIRAFENWGTLESLNILRNLKCPEDWMAIYARQVAADLEERLLHVPVS